MLPIRERQTTVLLDGYNGPSRPRIAPKVPCERASGGRKPPSIARSIVAIRAIRMAGISNAAGHSGPLSAHYNKWCLRQGAFEEDRAQMSLRNFPGYLGFTSKGVIAIHADWPIYPEEHGAGIALYWLTAFPPGTAFKKIDDIDRCVLLVADVPGTNWKDPFAAANHHVAVWHEDVVVLREKGLIRGASIESERGWERRRRKAWGFDERAIYGYRIDGKFHQADLPNLQTFDAGSKTWPVFDEQGAFVTGRGRKLLHALLMEDREYLRIHGARVRRLVDLTYYDTAVREAAVAIESQTTRFLGSKAFGQRLVDELYERLDSITLESQAKNTPWQRSICF